MLLQFLILTVASIVVIALGSIANEIINLLLQAHFVLGYLLGKVFSSGPAGKIIIDVLGLMIIPLVIGAVPALIYYAIKRQKMPHLMHAIWGGWFVVATAVVLK